MPTYQYKCDFCGFEFEHFISISSYKKEQNCPLCMKPAKLKISGGAGLIFRGSGFYITDYKRKATTQNFNKK